MAHIVTERCVNSRYTDCCTVCPADCFFEVADPAMLVIDPNTCIDCELCVAECPVQAIWPEDELPEEYVEWVQKNADLAPTGTLVNARKDPLEGALPLDKLQAQEKERGWSITEPSAIGGGGDEEAGEGMKPAESVPAAATVSVSEADVLSATVSGRFKWRSARGLAGELKGAEADIQTHLDQLTTSGQLQRFANTSPNAPAVFGKA